MADKEKQKQPQKSASIGVPTAKVEAKMVSEKKVK